MHVDKPNPSGGWPPDTGTEATQLVDESQPDHAYDTKQHDATVTLESSRLLRYLSHSA